MERQEKLQIIFNILLVLTLFVLLMVLIVLIKNKDIIKNDPLVYGMKVHKFDSCSCIGPEGTIQIGNTKFLNLSIGGIS